MTWKEAYKNLLRELDKFESPTFTIGDFNYFFNLSISKYITDNYGDFDVIQKDVDDIKELLKYDVVVAFTTNKTPLPADYRHCLGVTASATFTEDTVDYGVGDTITLRPQRMQTNRKGYADDNAYQQPSYLYPTYMIGGSELTVRCSDKLQVTEGTIDYICIPDVVALSNTPSDPVNDTPLQFSEYVAFEIIKVCRQIFLENIESVRYQTTLNENQITKTKE